MMTDANDHDRLVEEFWRDVPGFAGWRVADDLRDQELAGRALNAYLACLGRAAVAADVRALDAGLRAYQAAEDSRLRLAAAVATARVEADAFEARGVAALDVASRLVAAVIRPTEAVEDAHLAATDLGKLGTIVTELADEFDAWLDGRVR